MRTAEMRRTSDTASTTALVIVHLSSLDAYAESVGIHQAEKLARRIILKIQRHNGPIYVVDQDWEYIVPWSGPRRSVVLAIARNPKVRWIRFDEAIDDWDRFLLKLRRVVRENGIESAVVGGIWFDPKMKTGCATEVYLFLKSILPSVKADRNILGCEED